MKNILFVSTIPFNPSFGGVERVTDKLCRELLKLGYNCFYLCYPFTEPYDINSCAVRQDFFPEQDYNSQKNRIFLKEYIKTNKIDVLINQNGMYEHSYLFLNIGDSSCKRISVLHNDPLGIYNHLWGILKSVKKPGNVDKIKRIIRCILYPKIKIELYLSYKRHYRFIRDNSDVVITLSKGYFKDLHKIAPGINTFAIPNANTYEDVVPINPENKNNIVLYVGRLDERQKKISRLIKIWREIYDKFPKWELYIVGGGKDEYLYKKLALNLERIHFTGQCDPTNYYKKSKIICLTSDFEGFGMCLTEGMQYGCVPIAFGCYPALKDIITSGKTGEIIKPFNSKEYKNKLSELMLDSKYLGELSRNAIKEVHKFDIEKILPLWIEVIEK